MYTIILITIASAKVIIGNLPKSVDESLHFKVDERSMRIQYCIAREEYREGISNNEFNYPDPLKFSQLNQKLLQLYITSDVYQEMSLKAALYHYDNWRCKQYTIYDYNDQKFTSQLINIKNRILSVLKSEQQDLNVFKQCKIWSYSLLINSQTQDRQLILNVDNSDSLQQKITYEYERQLIGAGLHQFIQTKIKFNEKIDGDVVILDELDIFTYIDKDEMDKLPYQTTLMTIVDIEKPSQLSTQHIFLSYHQQSQEITYIMPYHFRYHLASDSHYKPSFVPNIPRVYVKQTAEEDQSDPVLTTLYKSTFVQANPQYLQEHLTYSIPTGYLPYKNIVFIITVGITLGMALHIAKLIMKDGN